MITAECRVVIGRPAEEVFAYLADPSHASDWQAAVSEVRNDSEEPPAIGSRMHESRRFLGQRLESTLEVAEFDPGRRLALKVVSGPVAFEVTHALTPIPGGTDMTIVLAADPGAFFKLAEPLVARVAQRELEDAYWSLKEILEARAR